MCLWLNRRTGACAEGVCSKYVAGLMLVITSEFVAAAAAAALLRGEVGLCYELEKNEPPP